MVLPVINVKSALLEITDKCYTGCHKEYCYKSGIVGPSALEVPMDIVKRRIDWLCDYTNTPDIALLGGEPLLHPQFPEIVEYVKSNDKKVSIITSGKVSHSRRSNLDYIVDLYSRGEIGIELSYHPSYNQRQYASLFKKLNVPENKDRFLSSTVTLNSKYDNPKKFKKVFEFIAGITGVDLASTTVTTDDKTANLLNFITGDLFLKFKKHYSDDELFSSMFNFSEGPELHLKYQLRSWGAVGIETQKIVTLGGKRSHKVINKQGGKSSSPCPAMTSSIGEKISINHLLIKSDGVATFPEPQCIAACTSFGSIDDLIGESEVNRRFSEGLDWLKTKIINTKSIAANKPNEKCKQDESFPKEFLDPKVYKCVNCNFNAACNICATTPGIPERPEEYIEAWMGAASDLI